MQTTLTQPETERPILEVPTPSRGARSLMRRGRATLCWGVAAFVLLQIGLRVVIDSFCPSLRDPTFEIKARQLQKALDRFPDKKPLTVCMFGSSVTGRCFNGKYLEKLLAQDGIEPAVLFNMSDHAAGPLTQLVYLRRLLERKIRPDLVLIEVFPVVFNSQAEPADIIHFPPYRLTEPDLEVVERYSANPDLRREWRLGRLVPSYFHRLPIVHDVCLELVPSAEQLPMWREYDDQGWYEAAPLTAKNLKNNLARVRATYQQSLKVFKPGQATMRAFEESLALLQEEGIPGVVVMMPQGPTMRSLYSAAGLAELKDTAMALSGRYGHGFLDAYTWLEEDMFTDSFHANSSRAKVFSERLEKELRVLLAGKW